MPTIDPNDPTFIRGLASARLGRRDFLRGVGVGAGALSLGAILAACSTGGGAASTPAASGASSVFDGQPAGQLNFANWAFYMDKQKDPQTGVVTHPSLDRFTQETGIQVNYQEVINSPESFFAKYRPQLAAGEDTGWDLMVITNGRIFDTMKRLGYFLELPRDRFPNFDKYAGPAVKDPAYDPGNRFSIPYQSGITGIGWSPKLVQQLRPDNPTISSYKDLLDPAFKGKVGFFGDTLDMPNLTLVGMGVEPETSTPADWQAGADMVSQARDASQIRGFYEANYINALNNGDVALSMAWSGDIFQSNLEGSAQGLQFTTPSEGGVIWTDNMTVPPKAQHPVDAITYMDYIYDPTVMAMMTAWINYVSPVPAARDVILQDAKDATDPADAQYLRQVANSPLVFPTAADAAKLHNYRVLTEAEDPVWLSTWQPVYQS